MSGQSWNEFIRMFTIQKYFDDEIFLWEWKSTLRTIINKLLGDKVKLEKAPGHFCRLCELALQAAVSQVALCIYLN